MRAERLTEVSFFADVGSIALCLICGDTGLVLMGFNLKRHCTSKYEAYCRSMSGCKSRESQKDGVEENTRVFLYTETNFLKQWL
jgi:hypothetical protein